jgi:hypothetical protein
VLGSLAADRDASEARARDIAFAFAEGMALALLTRHADWASRHGDDAGSAEAARDMASLLASSL